MVLTWGEQIALLVADVPWSVLLSALNVTGAGERFEVGPDITDWERWHQEFPADRTSTFLAGEYQGRSYFFSGASPIGPTEPDRVVALATATGGLVLAHYYDDTSGTGGGTAARANQLLRYVADGMEDTHAEGELLEGEAGESTIVFSSVFDAVITALGFEVDDWLARGEKWEVAWTSLNPDDGPEELKRLYLGPVRMRSMWIEEPALEEMGWRPDWWPEGGFPRPESAPPREPSDG